MKDGTCKCEVMGLDQIEAIRKRSRAGSSGPWVTDWDEMAKKTVFRRASKWLSLSPELRDAVNVDDDQIEHTLAVETITDKPASRVEAARARAGIQSEPQGEIAQEALAERDNDHEPDQAQDAVSEDEINRLMEQFKTVEPDKAKRMAYYKSVGIDPNKRIWPAAGVEAAWDHISELHDANKS
jgi:recombination protein RecT